MRNIMNYRSTKMNIKSSNNRLIVTGNIKSVEHYHTISRELNEMLKNIKEIEIHILDSISITSSVIGYLCKLVQTTNVSLSLYVKDDGLHTLLDELNLITLLNVQKM